MKTITEKSKRRGINEENDDIPKQLKFAKLKACGKVVFPSLKG